MSLALEKIREIVTRDMGSEFVRSLAIEVGWAYAQLYEDLEVKEELTSALKSEQFALRRGPAVVMAMVRACRQHGVPFGFRQLACNGQEKLVVKAGRIALIQEPMLTLADPPRTADYKAALADAHGLIRQLELDFGNEPRRITDWSGCILAAVLHGTRGGRFDSQTKMLGGLLLAVPNAEYSDWVMRIDLRNVALFGELTAPSSPKLLTSPTQQDLVRVTRRSRVTGTHE